MIVYLFQGKRPPFGYVISEIIAAFIAIFIIGPIAWMAFDRTGPWIRVSGRAEPAVVKRGQHITAIYRSTKLTRYCPGKVQREVIDSQRNLWPKLMASTVATWDPDPNDPNIGTVVTPGVTIPDGAAIGPATYRVSTFWYCNALQRWLDWPIVQVGPDIQFEILP